MISNGQQSDNRDDIVAEPMDGFSSLRLTQSWYKRSNSATGVDTNLAVLRHDTQIGDDTKRHAATASPAMTSMDKRVPDQVVRGSSVALPSGLWRSPTHPGIRHAAKPWEDGMVAIGPLFRARRRHAQVPGPIASRRSPYALGPASRVPLCGAIRPMVLSWTKVFLPISKTPRR